MAISDAKIREAFSGDFCLIGVGNDISGDDGFGPKLARSLKPMYDERSIDGGLAPENWTGPIKRISPQRLIIADAVAFDAKPGELAIFDPDDLAEGLPATHGPSFGPLLSYLSESIPDLEVLILAARPEKTGLMEPMSKSVKTAVDNIIKILGGE